MTICISSLDWANIAEGVPTLKQHLSLPTILKIRAHVIIGDQSEGRFLTLSEALS